MIDNNVNRWSRGSLEDGYGRGRTTRNSYLRWRTPLVFGSDLPGVCTDGAGCDGRGTHSPRRRGLRDEREVNGGRGVRPGASEQIPS